MQSRLTPPTTPSQAHAWLMTIGWGILIPLGVVIARCFKQELGPRWFVLHRALQCLGLACALAAFIVMSGFAVPGPHAGT